MLSLVYMPCLSISTVSLILSNILSGVYVVANMILIYRSQRQQLFQLWRGERSFIPPNCKQTHNDLLVRVSFLKKSEVPLT